MTESFVIHKQIVSPSPSSDVTKMTLKQQAFTLTAAGTTTLISVAADDVVLGVWLEVGTTAPDQNVEIGDADDPNRFITAGVVSAYTGVPYRYAAADTIDIKAAGSTSEGGGNLIVLLWHDA